MTTGDGFDEGGETACWMHLVCSECGAVLDDEGHVCDEAREGQPGATASGRALDRDL